MKSCLPITISSVLQSFCNFEQNLGWSSKLSFFIIYKFWQNCASFRAFFRSYFEDWHHLCFHGSCETTRWSRGLESPLIQQKLLPYAMCCEAKENMIEMCLYLFNVTVLILLPGTVTIHGITAGALFRKCLWTHNCNLVQIIFAVIMTLLNQAGPICVHIMITELLWHMQNCDLIGLLFFR